MLVFRSEEIEKFLVLVRSAGAFYVLPRSKI
jgi:hypothetical protein